MTDFTKLRACIEKAFENRELLKETATVEAVREVIEHMDKGRVRAAVKTPQGWEAQVWVKQAILLYFALQEARTMELAPFEFRDRIPLKKGLEAAGVRLTPPGAIRYGAHCERGVVVMPGYVNIGAFVGEGSMVDTWATVGTCAQIGKHVHLSGGVGIGGVLEPPVARPVIIEDGVFVGSRSIIVEGVHVEEGAVLGANTVITSSTPIIDVTGPKEVVYKGRVPARAIVIPGSRPKRFPAGEYLIPCGLIIGQRSASTDLKISLNAALRDHDVQA